MNPESDEDNMSLASSKEGLSDTNEEEILDDDEAFEMIEYFENSS